MKKKKKKTGKGKQNLLNWQRRSKGGWVVIPYVKDLSESVSRVMKNTWLISNYVTTLYAEKSLSPSQKQKEKKNTLCIMYEILCHSCELKCIDVTGRTFKMRQNEQQKDAKNVPKATPGQSKCHMKHVLATVQWQIISLSLTHVIDWKGQNIWQEK